MKANKLRLLQTSRTGLAEPGSDWGLYDWRVIQDRNSDFLSSTALDWFWARKSSYPNGIRTFFYIYFAERASQYIYLSN